MGDITCCPLSGSEDCGPSVYSTRKPRARKAHTCGECGETIPIGAIHEYVTGLWDGSWDSHRTCLSCVEIRDHFACEGWLFGMLWEDLEQNFFPDMRAGGPCMEGLSPEAKARLFEKRLAWAEHSHHFRDKCENDWADFGRAALEEKEKQR